MVLVWNASQRSERTGEACESFPAGHSPHHADPTEQAVVPHAVESQASPRFNWEWVENREPISEPRRRVRRSRRKENENHAANGAPVSDPARYNPESTRRVGGWRSEFGGQERRGFICRRLAQWRWLRADLFQALDLLLVHQRQFP